VINKLAATFPDFEENRDSMVGCSAYRNFRHHGRKRVEGRTTGEKKNVTFVHHSLSVLQTH
jgi:hypothetical protein